MPTRIQITVLLAVVTVAWGVTLWLRSIPLSWDHLAPFTTVITVMVGVGVAMEHFLWRIPAFQGWLFDRPDLRGTWRVTIESEWVDGVTLEKVAPITAYAGVTQTLSKLQIHLMTAESQSCSFAHLISSTPCGNRFTVSVVYANTPSIELRGSKSERHVGAAVFETHGTKFRPDSLTGEYWTDRRTVGRMIFEGRVSTIHSRYEDANRDGLLSSLSR